MKAYSKYRAVKTKLDGIIFDSKKEAKRYCELKLLKRAGEISDFDMQVIYPLIVNGVNIGSYRADFVYRFGEFGQRVVEDCKGFRTPIYSIKKKLMKAIHGIDILET